MTTTEIPSATIAPPVGAPPRRGVGRRLSAFLWRHPRLRLGLTLGPPLAWFLVVFLGSLAGLVWQSLYTFDDYAGKATKDLGLDTWDRLISNETNRDIVVRTVLMAASVTVACAVIAYPLAYYMARYATRRGKAILLFLTVLPLWSNYLVRVYSWKLILSQEGVLPWTLDKLGLGGALDWVLDQPVVGGQSLTFSVFGQFMVFTYVWLPYMVLPLHAALERVPATLVEAAGDLGARPGAVFRTVVWRLALPGVVAGSIFTFSLTLGDYIVPTIIGSSRPVIGGQVFVYQGVSGNLPLAAAFTCVPIVIMGIYLAGAKRLGAFEAL
jgi:putative spermidine/putrescine transport system permease protein